MKVKKKHNLKNIIRKYLYVLDIYAAVIVVSKFIAIFNLTSGCQKNKN